MSSQEILYDANFGDIGFVNCTFTIFYHFSSIMIHATKLYQQEEQTSTELKLMQLGTPTAPEVEGFQAQVATPEIEVLNAPETEVINVVELEMSDPEALALQVKVQSEAPHDTSSSSSNIS
ncbi:hypothetical protein KY285_004318 [Solanum tuberosum]|nr:hypothetical protein KY284_003710 [Solanum tuberosum]KAH0732718.1 hypothetical protein KY289_003906 [Solanum tuberosum]KAH0768447.1 hypothetical protein KY285_004318 [Solanum tuberosum]